MIKDVAHLPKTAGAAAWLTERIAAFEKHVVLSVVPEGYEAYARIVHPAAPGGSFSNLKPGQAPIRWAEVAKSRGKTAHGGMQWPSLVGTYRSGTDPRVKDHPGVEPDMGSLPLPVAKAVMEVLRGHTTTPEQCSFAAWEGWGFDPDDFVTNAPAFELPARNYLLVDGPIEAVLESLMDPPAIVVEKGLPRPHYQSPSLWWPDDRAWCVASEIDLQSTYVGGSRRCIEALLEDHQLETYEVQPSDGVTWDDDGINPKPDEAYP